MMTMDCMNFGKLRKSYESGRQDYSAEVMEYIFSLMSASSKVLDVGCGTGIATRQLAQRISDVFGCDVDGKMIETAQGHKDSIQYHVAPTEKMPFENDVFNFVTSFGAFHWFCDEKSVSEIKRVLKSGKFFIVVNKNESGSFRKDYKRIVEKLTSAKFPQSVKVNYDPTRILTQNGFSEVTERKFPYVEEFTIPKAMEQIQSMSL